MVDTEEDNQDVNDFKKNKMKRIVQSMLITCFFLTFNASAQNDVDALRYSVINYGSTARSLGMGNAFGALGADLSSMATNPAGIAVFRRSEFSFSPTFTYRHTQSDFLEGKSNDSKFNFNLGNFGMVWHYNEDDKTKQWKGWSFGIAYNRLNDFSSKSTAEGTNKNNSLLDSYAETADGTGTSSLQNEFPFDADLAYQSYLINTTTDSTHFASVIPHGGEFQSRTLDTKGGQGEWDFSFGTNYNDQLYFGVTLGIATLNYSEDLSWNEKDKNNTIITSDSLYDFKSFTYSQSLRTSGNGVNGKLGVIYRPGDVVRFGLAIHTPTSYTLTDEFATNIKSVVTVKDTNVTDGDSREWASPDFIPFNYKVITPFHAIGSVAFILGKQGIISAEYEFTDYNMASLRVKDVGTGISFGDVNKTIKKKYAASHTVRLGGEIRADKFRFRLGGSYSTTPFAKGFNDNSNTDQSRYSVTGGFGFKNDNFYFDVAYAYSHKGSFFKQYTLNDGNEPGITENVIDNRLMFTIGFDF